MPSSCESRLGGYDGLMPQSAMTPTAFPSSARLPPPHFAGRKDELALLNQGLDRLLQTVDLRAANRGRVTAGSRDDIFGFRVARTL